MTGLAEVKVEKLLDWWGRTQIPTDMMVYSNVSYLCYYADKNCGLCFHKNKQIRVGEPTGLMAKESGFGLKLNIGGVGGILSN